MSSNNPLSNIPPLGPPSGMAPADGAGKFKPVEPVKVLRQYWLLLTITAVLACAIGLGTWYGLDKAFPVWTSLAQLEVNKGLTSGQDTLDSTVDIRELEPEIQNNIQAIRSDELLNELLKNNAVQATGWYQQFQGNNMLAIRDLQDDTLKAAHQSNTTLIRLAVLTEDPEDAQTILRELVAVYLRRIESRNDQANAQDRRAFQNQRDTAIDRIETLTAEINRFTELHQMGTGSENIKSLTNELTLKMQYRSDIERIYSSSQAGYQALLERQEQGDFEPSASDVFLIQNSPDILNLDSQIRQYEVQIAALDEQNIAPNNPAVRRLKSELRSVQVQRDAAFDRKARELFSKNLEEAAQAVEQYRGLLVQVDAQINEIEAQRLDFMRKLETLESLERRVTAQEVARDGAEKLLSDLETRISRNISVSEYTSPTEAEKTFPKIEIVAPGVTILVMGLVVGGIFLREVLDQRLKGPGDVKAIPDTAMLGIIPAAAEDASSKVGVERVVEREPGGLLAESYRQVRTAILSKMDRRGYKTLMLIGPKPKAGTSTLAQNLGASMALSGRRVLVLDANFRRPAQAGLFGVSEQPGLSDLLSGELSLDQAQSAVHTMDGLSVSVLPAGQKGSLSPEQLETSLFRDLLTRLESSYDVILIDVAPALLASEGKQLAKHVDATVIVCRAKSDTRGMLQKVLSDLDGQRADILGVVLNGVRASAGGYMKKNFREFYRYRSNERGGASAAPVRSTRQPAAEPVTIASNDPGSNGSGTNGHYETPPTPDPDDDLDFDFEDSDDDNR